MTNSSSAIFQKTIFTETDTVTLPVFFFSRESTIQLRNVTFNQNRLKGSMLFEFSSSAIFQNNTPKMLYGQYIIFLGIVLSS